MTPTSDAFRNTKCYLLMGNFPQQLQNGISVLNGHPTFQSATDIGIAAYCRMTVAVWQQCKPKEYTFIHMTVKGILVYI